MGQQTEDPITSPVENLQKPYFDSFEMPITDAAPNVIEEAVRIRLLGLKFIPAPVDVEPFDRLKDGGVNFHEHKMEIGRPYPFNVRGVWLIAIRKSDDEGDVSVYEPE